MWILRKIKALIKKMQEPKKEARPKRFKNRPKSTLDEIEQSFKDNEDIAASVHKGIDSLQGKIT
jgi:hypothetical protein